MFFSSSSSTPAPSSSSSLLLQETINKGGCNSIKFNPWDGSLLAITTGLDGYYGGCLITDRSVPVPHQTTHFTVSPIRGLYDCSWSLTNQNLIIVAADSGKCHLIDINEDADSNPCQSFSRQKCIDGTTTTSVDWKPNSDSFLSASSDGTINHWSIGQPNPQYTNRHDDSKLVSCVTWNPQIPNVYASTCFDGYLRIRDIRGENPGIDIQADRADLNSCDWNWHGEGLIATASGCGSPYIKVWDIKQPRNPIIVLHRGHARGVLSVKFSSHRRYQIASSSNDNRVALWEFGPENAHPIFKMYEYHQKPVVGLDMNRQVQGQWASCGADGFHKWQHPLPEA